MESVLAARRDAPESTADLRTLQPTPLSSQLPPVTIPEYRALAAPLLDDYLCDYKLPPDAGNFAGRKLTSRGTVRVFLFDEKPYIHLPGAGDLQMFPTGRDTFTVQAVQGVSIAFERGANNEVKAVTLTLGDHTLRASRAQRQ